VSYGVLQIHLKLSLKSINSQKVQEISRNPSPSSGTEIHGSLADCVPKHPRNWDCGIVQVVLSKGCNTMAPMANRMMNNDETCLGKLKYFNNLNLAAIWG